NRKFGRRILFLDETKEPYEPGVFYCKDAFEGLSVMDKLIDRGERERFVEQTIQEAYEELNRPARRKRSISPTAQKTVKPAPNMPVPPFWGPKVVDYMPVEIVLQYLPKPDLFRLSWGA